MVVAALIEAADYKNFKLLCAYVNRARHYLYLLRKELKEIPDVHYERINWFDRVTLNLYAKDPAKDGKDPVLKDMTVPDFPGRTAFQLNWAKGLFTRYKYSKDRTCKQTGGRGLLGALLKVIAVAETAAYVVDRIAFRSIALVFNAYRWYLLEYMRKCKIRSNPCISHDYILVAPLRTTGKVLRGQGLFDELKDERCITVKKARPDFPDFSHYKDEVDAARTKNTTRKQSRR